MLLIQLISHKRLAFLRRAKCHLLPFLIFEVRPRSTRQTIFIVLFSAFLSTKCSQKGLNYYSTILLNPSKSCQSHAENLLQKLNSQRICGIFVDSSLISRTGEVVFYHSAILNGNHFSREILFHDFNSQQFHHPPLFFQLSPISTRT